MSEDRVIAWNGPGLSDEVRRRSGAEVGACFQCHKCSTGCPVGPDADYLPSQILRLVHLGAEEEALSSRAIWLCASCGACTARCPNGIDVAGVMDALRILSIDRGAASPVSRALRFNRCFLGSVRRHGRVYEMGLMAAYKLRTGDLLSDAEKVPRMLAQGKLALLPNRGGDAGRVREVFRRAAEEEKKT